MKNEYNQILEEVNAEQRKEMFLNLWNKWGVVIISFIIFVIIGLSGYSFHRSKKEATLTYYSEIYEKGKHLVAIGQAGEGFKYLNEASKAENYVYSPLSYFVMANHFEQRRDYEKTLEMYKKVAENKKSGTFYRNLAKLNIIRLEIDLKGVQADHQAQVESILKENTSLTNIALEIKGYLLFKKGEYDNARSTFIQLAQRDKIDPALRERAQAMTRLLMWEKS